MEKVNKIYLDGRKKSGYMMQGKKAAVIFGETETVIGHFVSDWDDGTRPTNKRGFIQFTRLGGAMTKEEAEMKDYRLNKEGKRMREIARELTIGKGYIIATTAEMRLKYGDRKEFGEHDDQKPAVWGIIEGKDYFSRNKEIRQLSFFTV